MVPTQKRLGPRARRGAHRLELGDDPTSPDDRVALPAMLDAVEEIGEAPRRLRCGAPLTPTARSGGQRRAALHCVGERGRARPLTPGTRRSIHTPAIRTHAHHHVRPIRPSGAKDPRMTLPTDPTSVGDRRSHRCRSHSWRAALSARDAHDRWAKVTPACLRRRRGGASSPANRSRCGRAGRDRATGRRPTSHPSRGRRPSTCGR